MGLKQWRQSWRDIRTRVREVAWGELSSGDRAVRFTLEITRLAMLRLRRHRAGMMAAALSYRVLFSLLPLLALAASIARLSVSKEEFLKAVHELVNQLGLQTVEIKAGQHAGSQLDLGRWIDGLATQAADVNVAGLTWIGSIVLVWAAYRLFDEIEASLSVIVAGNRRRATWARVLVSLVVLVVTPALAVWGLSVLAELTSQIDAIGYQMAATVGNWVLTLVMIWGIVLLAYRFIPAGRKGWAASAIGAFVAAVALLLGQWLIRRFAISAVTASPLGGSLGMVPLLMLWVYVMCICVLYGAELAAILDHARWRWRAVQKKLPGNDR